MSTRRPVALTHCLNCGARIIPTPEELKRWRLAAEIRSPVTSRSTAQEQALDN